MDLLDPPVRVGVFALSRRHLAEIGYVRETPRERELSAFEHGNHPYPDGKVAPPTNHRPMRIPYARTNDGVVCDFGV